MEASVSLWCLYILPNSRVHHFMLCKNSLTILQSTLSSTSQWTYSFPVWQALRQRIIGHITLLSMPDVTNDSIFTSLSHLSWGGEYAFLFSPRVLEGITSNHQHNDFSNLYWLFLTLFYQSYLGWGKGKSVQGKQFLWKHLRMPFIRFLPQMFIFLFKIYFHIALLISGSRKSSIHHLVREVWVLCARNCACHLSVCS